MGLRPFAALSAGTVAAVFGVRAVLVTGTALLFVPVVMLCSPAVRRRQTALPAAPASPGREVLTGLALRDMPLRISVAVTGLLLAARVPLPGFAPTGPYAAFHTTSARLQPAGPRHECTAGEPA
jgi:hypothetical protein